MPERTLTAETIWIRATSQVASTASRFVCLYECPNRRVVGSRLMDSSCNLFSLLISVSLLRLLLAMVVTEYED